MQPRIQLLSPDLVQRILGEAFQLMMDPGIKVLSSRARELLQAAGADVQPASPVVRIPEAMARDGLGNSAEESSSCMTRSASLR